MLGIELARRKLQLSKEYVQRETGYKGSGQPSMAELASLCVLFGVSGEELLKDYPYPYLTPEERDFENLKSFKESIQKGR